MTPRRATLDDCDAIGRLLHAFNREFDEPCPEPHELSARFAELLTSDREAVLLIGDGPDGLAVLRFRPSIWSTNLECYVAELYVDPELRGNGLGRALMVAAIELARSEGADHMDLGTSDDDSAARGLYESLGFTNREGSPDGPVMLYYERGL